MAEYPSITSVGYSNPFKIVLEFDVLKNKYGYMGKEYRKIKSLYPRRHVSVSYNNITKVEAKTLWQFYVDRHGTGEAFNLFYADINVNQYENEYVGTGDNVSVTWNLPSKQASSIVVYIDGVIQTVTTDYSISILGGEDSADQITFVVAPTSGQKITIDFDGVLKIRSRFKDDKLSYSEFYNRLCTMGMKMEGLLNE